ncbi:MAG: carboxypeptidase-like regulatory domain-containing protein [Myxococcaceae bacterium]
MAWKASAGVLLGLALTACGKGSLQIAETDKLQGLSQTVFGQVLTTAQLPLAGAVATLAAGEIPLSATTDAAGNFAFSGLPSGAEVLVTVSKDGYATHRQVVKVPGLVGPIALTKLDGTVSFVLAGANGKPAKGAQAVLEASPASLQLGGSSGTGTGVVQVTAVANEAGTLTFTGLPTPSELTRVSGTTASNPLNYVLTISAVDSNGDGVIDSAGEVRAYSAKELLAEPSPRVIALKDPRGAATTPLAVIASNVPSLNGTLAVPSNMVKPGEALVFVFNQALQPTSVLVRFTNENGSESLTHTLSFNSGGTVLGVIPAKTLDVGAEYNVMVHAVSLDNGTTLSSTGFFFGGDPTTPRTPSSPTSSPVKVSSAKVVETIAADGMLNKDEKLFVYFDQPVGAFGVSNPFLYAYAQADLNGSGAVGDAAGEKGFSGVGFPVQRSEPSGEASTQFMLKPSSYTTRYLVTYAPASPGALPSLPSGTQWTLAFAKSTDATSGFQTLWGQTLTLNVDLTVVGAVPP